MLQNSRKSVAKLKPLKSVGILYNLVQLDNKKKKAEAGTLLTVYTLCVLSQKP